MKTEMDRSARLNDFFKSRVQTYMDIFENMVGINSYTFNAEGVNRLGAVTSGIFSEYGFTASEVQSVNPGCGRHLILHREGVSPFKIGCVSHLDTVFTKEEEMNNSFAWSIEGRRVFGPGTIDVKGGTVMILMMVDALSSLYPEIFSSVSWDILLDATEEIDSADFGDICRRRLDREAVCLVFEAGDFSQDGFSLVTSRKGRAVFGVRASGKSVHSGSDHSGGQSAVVMLADAVKKIDSITDYKRGVTVNIGHIEGGGALNRVPSEAFLRGEVRSFSPEELQRAVDRILDFNNLYAGSEPGFHAFIENVVVPWPENPDTERLFSFWRAAAEETSFNVQPEARGGLSDGNFTRDVCPTIDGLGPSGKNSHSSVKGEDRSEGREYADLDSIIPKAVLNTIAVIEMIV